MKQVIVVDTNEMMQAVIAMLGHRNSLKGKFVAAVHMIADDKDPRPELRIRANVVVFDTEQKAREYAAAEHPEDIPKPVAVEAKGA